MTYKPDDDTTSAAVRVPHTTPKQHWTTDGIPLMNQGGLFARFFLGIVAFAERLNLACAKFGNPCVYDNAVFPWVEEIEGEWRKIRGELDHLLIRKDELPNIHDISPDAAAISQDSGWKIFLLIAYGIKSPLNIALCPETWRLAQKVPGLMTAMFSVLEPGKRLPPHRGPYNGVLRLHLGLIVPAPESRQGIRIGPKLRSWQEGRVLIFDDAYEHEAWNETGHPRVVLFVDFAKPLKFPANLLNWVLLRLAVFAPYLREGNDRLRRWERRFHENSA
jgi:beta-hydroxylase